MDYRVQFNDTLLELVDDLIRVFPNDRDFRMYKLAIQGAMITKPRMIHDVFRERVCSTYGDKILGKDEDFFLSNNYQDMRQEFSEADNLINKLKSCWTMLTPDQRDIVWKYLGLLILLDRKMT